jgi:serine/threonine-protein kinase HipA
MTTVASVEMWGTQIGAVAVEGDAPFAVFEYNKDFLQSGIEVAPLTMPLSAQIYTFPNLAVETFHGLPGLLADSLPDKFGNVLLERWMRARGTAALNSVERLCYTGKRGMGALEFKPAADLAQSADDKLELDELAVFAESVLKERESVSLNTNDADIFSQILKVGTSAGGARAKAIIAYNQQTGEVRSGQADAPDGFTHWIVKFGGVASNADKEGPDKPQYTRIEYAYYLMAKAAGIDMADSRLIEGGGGAHFITRRFDRPGKEEKLHMQTLGAMAHFDFNNPLAHSYEQAFDVCGRLGLPSAAVQDLFRRMCFNVVAQNNDDQVKNISFLMDKTGRWFLAPAYDMTYAYKPEGLWTGQHQMSINGKRAQINKADLLECAKFANIKSTHAQGIIDQVLSACKMWPSFAQSAQLDEYQTTRIGPQFIWPK